MIIETKYLGATNTLGARIKATTVSDRPHRVTVPYDYSLNTEENHRKCARLLFEKLGWDKDGETRKAYIGQTNRGYTYTFHYGWNEINF